MSQSFGEDGAGSHDIGGDIVLLASVRPIKAKNKVAPPRRTRADR